MATVGRGAYADAVHQFFEGMCQHDAEAACSVLADDADMQSPWNEGVLTGKPAVQEMLEAMLSDPVKRPSFTIKDITGDGHVTTLTISMSGRFGAGPVQQTWKLLHLKGKIHQVIIQ